MDEARTLIQETPSGKRRLNPFAFPPETNAFFVLLAITALVWMLELGQIVEFYTGQISRFPLILIILVFLLATALYLSHPIRIRYRKRLRRLTREEDPKFMDAVQGLINASRISSPPRIEVAAHSRSVDGQAFGLWKNYSLRLGGRLRLLFRQDPESFRAIILHELAHIANADIWRAYFIQALWMAVVILTVLPVTGLITDYFIRTSTNQSDLAMFPVVLLTLLKIGISLLIITAIYSNLLRSREYYADWRTALWGAGEALAKILHRARIEKTETNRWTRIWKLHPTAKERLEVIQDPNQLFLVKPALAFFTGVLPGLMLGLFAQAPLLIQLLAGPVAYLEQRLGPNLSSTWGVAIVAFIFFIVLAIPGFIIVYLITNSLGLAVQRETVARLDAGQLGGSIYLPLWKPATMATIGFQVGSLLTISSILELFPILLESPEGRFYLLLMLILTIILAVQTWLGLIYVSVFARQLLGAHVGKSAPISKMRLLTFVLTILLLIFYIPMVFAQEVIYGVASGVETSMLGLWLQAVILAELAAIFTYILVFAVTGILVGITRRNRKQLCPTCGQITRQRYAVGRTCESCGSELAAWLYAV